MLLVIISGIGCMLWHWAMLAHDASVIIRCNDWHIAQHMDHSSITSLSLYCETDCLFLRVGVFRFEFHRETGGTTGLIKCFMTNTK